MSNTRLYIVQILGIFLLICGYLLSDQPDSLSVMHFDPNPSSPSVFTKAVKSGTILFDDASVSQNNNSSRKTETPKYISFEVVLSQKSGYAFHQLNNIFYSSFLKVNYEYLYFKEINPPPPKAC